MMTKNFFLNNYAYTTARIKITNLRYAGHYYNIFKS